MSPRLALVIGNNEYHDSRLARLVTPGEDANDLAEVLRAPEIGGFDDVVTLINQSAPVVRRAVARLFADKKPDDLLLLYFSGHGVRDELGLLYLAAQDTELDLLNATAIPASFVTEEMDRSRSRRQLLILDCCHSGAFAQGAKGAPGASVGTAAAFEGTGFGRVVLTATDATQYAWEGDQLIGQAENSVFTRFVVEGLHTGQADTDGDGRITLDELYDYVYEQVVTKTSRQTPRKFAYNQQGEVVIARNPRPVVRPAELPPELRQAVESPLTGVREGAVRELERLLHGSHRGLAQAALEALRHLEGDDSRRVSSAAAAALAGYAESQRAGGAPAVRPAPPEPPAAEAAGERPTPAAAPPPAEQAPPPVVTPPPAAPPVAAQREGLPGDPLGSNELVVLTDAQREQLARGLAAARRDREPITVRGQRSKPPAAAAVPPPRAVVPPASAAPASQAPAANRGSAFWLPVLVTTSGWALAWAIGGGLASLIFSYSESSLLYYLGAAVYWIVPLTLGAVVLGLVLRLTFSWYAWPYVLLLVIAWGSASVVGVGLYALLSSAMSSTLSGFLSTGLMGLAAGAATWRTVAWAGGLPGQRALALVAGAWFVGLEAAALTASLPGGSGNHMLVGAVAGAIGGGVLFRLLSQERARPA